jgi:plastocyanin
MMAASVKIMSFAFTPSSLSVHAGTRVTFTNQDAATHTVTSDGGLFGSGNLATGQSFSFTFMSRGSFAYHCSIHPSMKGTVTVTS